MSKRFLSLILVLSPAVFAASLPPNVDAFLSRREVLPLVDARGLNAAARAALTSGQVTSVEPRYGVPTFFWSGAERGGRTFRDMGLSPAEAARRYLLTHAEIYRAEVGRWAEAQVSHVHDLGDGTAVIVTFQQRVKGVRVFRDELKVIMTPKLELVALAGYLTPQTKALGAFSLTSHSAIGSAFQHLTGRSLTGAELVSTGVVAGGYEEFRLAGTATPARARPVYFPLPEGVMPGFYVELDVPTTEVASSYFSFVVSAVDGAVLYRKNLTSDAFTYKVWAETTAPFLPFDGPQGTGATPHPTGSPSNFNPGTATQELITLDNAGLSTNDPWLDPAATTTQGNNVRAYADIAASNGFGAGDVMGTVTDAGVFEYTYDFMVGPEANVTQRQAAVVQLFFDNNVFHDWYYDDGFNEAAGNAQANNLGRGGIGNDVLRVEAQDYSGRNNANMSTPSDGASPRMQMYVFDAAGSETIIANTATPQTFNTGVAEFGPQAFDVTAALILANDGSTTPTGGAASGTVTDACQALPAGFATGKILLVDRGGGCTFASKAEAAQAAGALGVIIANNQQGGAIDLPGTSAIVTIPTMSVGQQSGGTLKTIITNGGGNTTVTMRRQTNANRDGTLDNGVVAHEWGHYISNRLIGDGNGISNLQAVGMGEGWADFHAGLMMTREADLMVASNANWGGAYGLAGWAGSATDQNAYYFGFRRYPLSYEFSRNPLTFKHISDGVRLPTTAPVAFGASGADNAEVHNTGEVWAVMLWDCYVVLLRDARNTFPQAKMKRYLVASYKATPIMPTFVDARDAVLAVAAASDMQDFAAFMGAFARRGLGIGAVAPDRDSQSNSPLTESFVAGNAAAITEVSINDATTSCDNDGNLDANEKGVLTIKVRNTGTGALTNATVNVQTTTAGVTFPSGGTATLPTLQPFGVTTVTLPVELGDVAGAQGGMFVITITDSSLVGPVTQTAMFRLNYDVLPASSRFDDVESPMSNWTAGNDPNGATGSDFRVFQSTATQHFWFGPNPASPADTWLISPALQVGTDPVTISFKHRFDFERSNTEFFDGAVIEVSANGGAWTDLGSSARPGYTGTISTSQNQSANPLRGRMAFVGKSVNYPTFNTETVELGTRFQNQTVRFRFRIGADDAAAAKGWEIDDILFVGIVNRPFTSVTSDPNSCTNGAPTLTVGPSLEVFEREEVKLVATATDPDMDPVTFTWTQLSGPMVTINDGTFIAPDVDVDTVITVQVSASDGRAVTLPQDRTVLVKNQNRAPVASVPATIEVNMGETVQIAGSGTDPDADFLAYEWSQVSGPTVTIAGANAGVISFVAPQVETAEVVRIQLVVNDAMLASAPAIVDVVVKNPNPVVVEPEMPKGCGCATGAELLPLLLLGLVARRKRKR